jgi:Cell wall-associated hydrolases (invasion-associated proteins)
MREISNRKMKRLLNKSGFTWHNILITLAILAVIIAIATLSYFRFSTEAYMTRANDSAEVIYMALQAAITDLKTEGTFEETFSNAETGADTKTWEAGDDYATVPLFMLTGKNNLIILNGIEAATDGFGALLDDDVAQRLYDEDKLIYMKLSRTDDSQDSKLLKTLLKPYIGDETILNQTVLVEINLNNQVVRCAFYSEQANEFNYNFSTDVYGQFNDVVNLKKDKENVILRDRASLYDKRQGYYGGSSIGMLDELYRINEAYVTVDNSDMLVIEWGDFTPRRYEGASAITDAQADLDKITYDISIVNKVDASKVYYKLRGVSAQAQVNGNFIIPRYDLHDYDQADNAYKESNLVEIRTEVFGTGTVTDFKHRLSYAPNNGTYVSSGNVMQAPYGVYRLILDSLPAEGEDSNNLFTSIKDVYDQIPANEDFRVIVEAKYDGEGFEGSMIATGDSYNAYFEEKIVYTDAANIYYGDRGAGTFNDFLTAIVGKPVGSNMGYALSYSRHLENARHLMSGTIEADGYMQNLVLTDDIDWSLQKIGAIITTDTNGDEYKLHKLTVSNAPVVWGTNIVPNIPANKGLKSFLAESLSSFRPIEVPVSENADGFAGRFISEVRRDEDGVPIGIDENGNLLPVGSGVKVIYENYKISNLKLESEDKENGDYVGLFAKTAPESHFESFTINGVTAYGSSYIGGVAGSFLGYANNLTVKENLLPNRHMRTLATFNTITRKIEYNETPTSANLLRAFQYAAGSRFEGNTIKAVRNANINSGFYAGGITAYLGINTGISKSGLMENITNGTNFDATLRETLTNTSGRRLDGIVIKAERYAGGIVGIADKETKLLGVANVANVTSVRSNAGGIVGAILEDTIVSGLISLEYEDASGGSIVIINEDKFVRVERTYEYVQNNALIKETSAKAAAFNNYGRISAGANAGGIVGVVLEDTALEIGTKHTLIEDVANIGTIQAVNVSGDTASGHNAGGIVGLIENDGILASNTNVRVDIKNVINMAYVSAVKSNAGGIAGQTIGQTTIVGAKNRTTLHTADRNGTSDIYAVSGNAGGIIGYAQDNSVINNFIPDKSIEGITVAIATSRNITIDNVVANTSNLQTYNEARIRSNAVNAGGIIGKAANETRIGLWDINEEPTVVFNSGTIWANTDNAGGIVGEAIDKVEIYNTENKADATINANRDNAGGIVGKIDSRDAVRLQNSIKLAKETNGNIKTAYYTNEANVTAVRNNAGGIVGFMNTISEPSKSVSDVFNKGKIIARGDNAGGIFGVVMSRDNIILPDPLLKLEYDEALLFSRIAANLYTNHAVIVAKNNAGGIAGKIETPNVYLYNTFNGGGTGVGEVNTDENNAGGIVGFIEAENRKSINSDLGHIIYYSENVLDNLVFGSDDIAMNAAQIVAGRNNAGGIAGRTNSRIRNVFNKGRIQAKRSNAGGIVGFVGGTEQKEIYNDSRYALKIIESATAYRNNRNLVATDDNAAGGIIGYSETELEVKNMFNGGQVWALDSDAGGMIGHSTKKTKIYAETNVAIAQIDNESATNIAYVRSTGQSTALSNAGGIIGHMGTELLIVHDVFNSGDVDGYKSNVGGIAGYIEALADMNAYSEIKLTGENSASGVVVKSIAKNWLTNSGKIHAIQSNSGGIVGHAAGGIYIHDVFNGYNNAVTPDTAGVYAGQNNAGGIAGLLEGRAKVEATPSVVIVQLENITDSFLHNQTSVYAAGNNAGGIIGKTDGNVLNSLDTSNKTTVKNSMSIQVKDMYSGHYVSADDNTASVEARNNAGGLIGRMAWTTLTNNKTVDIAIEHGVYTNTAKIKAEGSNAGGIIGNADIVKSDDVDTRWSNVNYNDINLYKDAQTNGRNEFYIEDVYNSGTVEAGNNNAGGIFGVAGDGTYYNDAERIKLLIEKQMYNNEGNIKAGYDNAGGIFGFTTRSFNPSDDTGFGGNTKVYVANTFNSGDIVARNNAGGIAGKAVGLDLQYTKAVLSDSMKVEIDDANIENSNNDFLYSNSGKVTASADNAGGIIGDAKSVILKDMFNSAVKKENFVNYEYLDAITSRIGNGDIVINAENNAGGLVGRAEGLDISYSSLIKEQIMKNKDYVYTNIASVRAARYNAGGILGYGMSQVSIVDAYNMGRVLAGVNNSGGIVGELIQHGDDPNVYIEANDTSSEGPEIGVTGIKLEANQVVRYANDSENILTMSGAKGVSYITYTTTVPASAESYGYVNRYSSRPKLSEFNDDRNIRPNVEAGSNNAGGIVGYAVANARYNSGGGTDPQYLWEKSRIRIENAFVSKDMSNTNPNAGGIWARGTNAGGLIGYSAFVNVSYSFKVNANYLVADEGLTGAAAEAYYTDYSVFNKVFNSLEARKDPYVMEWNNQYHSLGMVANNAAVYAAEVCEYRIDRLMQTNQQFSSTFHTGEQPDLVSENAGGAIGRMVGGRIERVYSLQGKVESPKGVGGVVGYAAGAMIKQVTRLKITEQDVTLGLATAQEFAMSQDISLATEVNEIVKRRGSIYVGGIVGRAGTHPESETSASNSLSSTVGTQVIDVRNYLNVTARTAVGGIIGYAEPANGGLTGNEAFNGGIDHIQVVLAQNAASVKGVVETEDNSYVDGSYVGGIIGRIRRVNVVKQTSNGTDYYDTINPEHIYRVKITMAKNDPKISENFYDLELNSLGKYSLGGNSKNQITGKSYVGGITGAYGIINYSINTGRINGGKILGGISGSAYRITNSYNTANITGNRTGFYRYDNPNAIELQDAYHIGGIAGEIERTDYNPNDFTQVPQKGAYLQNVYNSSQIVRGSSFIGGIVGYSNAPINTAYNSATISAKQTVVINEEGQAINEGLLGIKIGGIVGVLAQDKLDSQGKIQIKVSNAYNAGDLLGSSLVGSIIGEIEGYGEEQVVDAVRAENVYYISDNNVQHFNTLTSQIALDINYNIPVIGFSGAADLGAYILNPHVDAVLSGETAEVRERIDNQDKEYGLRPYNMMVSSGLNDAWYELYGNNSSEGMGDKYLKTFLDYVAPSGQPNIAVDTVFDSTLNLVNNKRVEFEYATFEDEAYQPGFDYEFPHFTGTQNRNPNDKIIISEYTNELSASSQNQAFRFVDNTQSSTMFAYWPMKAMNHLKSTVEYNDNGAIDTSEYNNGRFVQAGQEDIVNINYRGDDLAMEDFADWYPLTTWTKETITLKAEYEIPNEGELLPAYIVFSVYDGHSRAKYSATNTEVLNLITPKRAVKSYMLARKDIYDIFVTSNSNAIPDNSDILNIDGVEYILYVSDTTGDSENEGQESIEFISGSYDPVEQIISIELNCFELETYMAPTTGYFTLETTVIYDTDIESDDIEETQLNTVDKISRMFSMHMSNETLNYTCNDSFLDESYNAGGDYNFDDIVENAGVNGLRTYTKTAALGGYRVEDANKDKLADLDDSGNEIILENRLIIRNERHLYNLNQGNEVGYGQLGSSDMNYLSKHFKLWNDIRLSTHDTGNGKYNGFMIGVSKDMLYRMTGSIDGSGYTIGNLQVDRLRYPGRYGTTSDIKYNSYALIYDLSGGVIKNLNIGDDSRIIANEGSAIAVYVSNGRSPDKDASGNDLDPELDVNNAYYENVGAKLLKEAGTSAKIYDVNVYAQINAVTAGGIAVHTGRRFKTQGEMNVIAQDEEAEAQTISVVMTDVKFGGKINEIYDINTSEMGANSVYNANNLAKAVVDGSFISWNNLKSDHEKLNLDKRIAAGILTYISGKALTNDIIIPGQIVDKETEHNSKREYATTAELNNAQVEKDGYVFAHNVAAGVLGEARVAIQLKRSDEQPYEIRQVGIIKKSVNNGVIISNEQSSGISQGVELNNENRDGTTPVISSVNVYYSYNNGIVQTPLNCGLASGIGNIITVAENTTNNGYVYGYIASGITNYSDKNAVVKYAANNGYVEAAHIAGGIIAAPSYFNNMAIRAEVNPNTRVKIENAYNSGTVIVRNNKGYDGTEKAFYSSYAGGILGYASGLKEGIYNWSDKYLNEIRHDELVTVKNTYNVGIVKYLRGDLDTGSFSTENRNIGGIVGGGLNRFVNISNSYSLSDPQLKETAIVAKYCEIVDGAGRKLGTGIKSATNNNIGRGYNYKLEVVGDTTYAGNVTTMSYEDMIDLVNYVGFDGNGWAMDYTTEVFDNAGTVLYPFPQYKNIQTGPAYTGDTTWNLSGSQYSFTFNEQYNRTMYDVNVAKPMDYMDLSDMKQKTLVNSSISYQRDAIAQTSEYSINIAGYNPTKTYNITVYDGDAYETQNYAPAIIREYVIDEAGIVFSGDRDNSIQQAEIKFFSGRNVEFNNGTLTIKDTEEKGWSIPRNGFHTVVVTQNSEFTGGNNVTDNAITVAIEGEGSVKGNIKTAVRDKVNQRFNIHFGGTETFAGGNGSNITDTSGIYLYGSKDKPYYVTDQYSVIGMTTAGIVKDATRDRYYRQIDNILISEDFYSIFEFNGNYNALVKAGDIAVDDDQDGVYTLTQENKDVGFISYLRGYDKDVPDSLADIKDNAFATAVHSMKYVLLGSSNDREHDLGKYQEASNYVANIGLISDYMEGAIISGVTVDGELLLDARTTFNQLATNDYGLDGKYILSGVAAVTKRALIEETTNRADIGAVVEEKSLSIIMPEIVITKETEEDVEEDTELPDAPSVNSIDEESTLISGSGEEGAIIEVTSPYDTIYTTVVSGGIWSINIPDSEPPIKNAAYTITQMVDGKISLPTVKNVRLILEYTYYKHENVNIAIAGISSLAVESEYKYIANDGIISSRKSNNAGQKVAGLIHTARNSKIEGAMNGGWVRTDKGTAVGLFANIEGSNATKVYNAGKVSASLIDADRVGRSVYDLEEVNPSIITAMLGNGTALGIADVVNGTITEGYNAGYISANRNKAAIGRNNNGITGVYYLTDDLLYWADVFELPDFPASLVVTESNVDEMAAFIGFATGATEVVLPYLNSNQNPEVTSNKRLAVTYSDLKNKKQKSTSTNILSKSWVVSNDPENITIDAGNALIRDYGKDSYELPTFSSLNGYREFAEGSNIIRDNLNFTVFIGLVNQIGTTPDAEYERYNVRSHEGKTQIFKDTLHVSLENADRIAKYDILLYEGDVIYEEVEVPDNVEYGDVDTSAMKIEIVKKYINVSNISQLNNVVDQDTKYYTNIFTSGSSIYYYEILPDSSGVRPAIFVDKNMQSGNKLEILLNNNILDTLQEMSYHGVTIVEYSMENEETDPNDFFVRFNPHFADAIMKQTDGKWDFGTKEKPYEISTQRNLNNLSLGGSNTDLSYKIINTITTNPNVVTYETVTDTSYLASGIYYKQSQDIPMLDKKISTNGTNDGIEIALWQQNIGTNEIEFAGTYDGSGYQILNKRGNETPLGAIKSLFQNIAGTATIKDFTYVLPKVNRIVIQNGSQAVIVNESKGTISDINVVTSADNTNNVIITPMEQENFAVIVGKTVETDGFVPKLSNITVGENIELVTPTNNRQKTIGSIIGQADGSVLLTNIISNALVSDKNTAANVRFIGGLVGRAVNTKNIANAKIEFNNVEYLGEINIVNSVNKLVGGILGSAENIDVNVNAAKVANEISLSQSSNGNNGAYGGIIGSTTNASSLEIKNSNAAGISINSRYADGSYGGVVGIAKDIDEIYMDEVESGIIETLGVKPVIKIEKTTQGNQTNKLHVGGIFGTVIAKIDGNPDVLKLTNVINNNDIKVVAGGNDVHVGGIAGYTEGYGLADVKNVVSKGSIDVWETMQGGTGKVASGGLFGSLVSNGNETALTLKTSAMKIEQEGSTTNSNKMTHFIDSRVERHVGGYIGYLDGYKDVIIDDDIANGFKGFADGIIVKNGRLISNESSVGGIVGTIRGPNNVISNIQISNIEYNNDIEVTMSAGVIGGLVGRVDNYENVVAEDLKNMAEIKTIDLTYEVAEINVGGIFGRVKANGVSTISNPNVFDLNNVSAVGVIDVTHRARISHVGGIVSYVSGYDEINTTNVNRNNQNGIKVAGVANTNATNSTVGGIFGTVEAGNSRGDFFELNGVTASVPINVTNNSRENHIGGYIGHVNGYKAVELVVSEMASSEPPQENVYDINVNGHQSGTQSTIGGVIGKITGSLGNTDSFKVENFVNYRSIKTDDTANMVGGLVGYLENYETIEAATVSNASRIKMEDTNNINLDNVYVGGIFGKVKRLAVANSGNTINLTNVTNTEAMNVDSSASNNYVSGIIADIGGYDVNISDTVNSSNISITQEDARNLYAAGIIARINSGSMNLEDTASEVPATNISNIGNIEIEIEDNNILSRGNIYASGGIAYADATKIDINGFRNSGDILVKTKDNVNSNRDEDVYLSGVLARNVSNGTDENIKVNIINTVNDGNISDNREDMTASTIAARTGTSTIKTAGKSEVGGIVGTTIGLAGTSITYSHNVGSLKGETAAGIVHTVADIEGGGTVESIKDSEVKYNINVGTIDVRFMKSNGDSITLTNQLAIGRGIATSSNAVASASNAEIDDSELKEFNAFGEPLDGSAMSEGDVIVFKEYYNLSLSDMVAVYEGFEIDTNDWLEKAYMLDLGEMSQGSDTVENIMKNAGWTSVQIASSQDATQNPEAGWIVYIEPTKDDAEEIYLLPVVRENEVSVEVIAPHTTLSIFNLALNMSGGNYVVSFTYDEDGTLRGRTLNSDNNTFALRLKDRNGKTVKVITLEAGVTVATRSNAIRSTFRINTFANNATESNATKSDAVSINTSAAQSGLLRSEIMESEGNTAIRYSYTLDAKYIADITNALTKDTEFTLSVGAVDDKNGRAVYGKPMVIELSPTDNAFEFSDRVEITIVRPMLRRTLGTYNLAYSSEIGLAVVDYAITREGDPYSMELAGFESYLDCSYLVLEAYRTVGINLPRTAAEQAKYMVDNGYVISGDELMPGDLIYYSFNENGRFMNIGHTAIYAGNGMIIEASSVSGNVIYNELKHFESHVLYARPYANQYSGVLRTSEGQEIYLTNEEIYLAAQIVGLEARGTGVEGMVAVAEVIKNRVLSNSFENTVTEVLSASGQFTTYAMIDRYVPTQEQIDIVMQVMAGEIEVLGNPDVLFFCGGYYYDAIQGTENFWSNMEMVANYGNYFFIK